MKTVVKTALIAAFSLAATHAVSARHHHGTTKSPATATKRDAKIPIETKRDPADIALDRKIKGICTGC